MVNHLVIVILIVKCALLDSILAYVALLCENDPIFEFLLGHLAIAILIDLLYDDGETSSALLIRQSVKLFGLLLAKKGVVVVLRGSELLVTQRVVYHAVLFRNGAKHHHGAATEQNGQRHPHFHTLTP